MPKTDDGDHVEGGTEFLELRLSSYSVPILENFCTRRTKINLIRVYCCLSTASQNGAWRCCIKATSVHGLPDKFDHPLYLLTCRSPLLEITTS